MLRLVTLSNGLIRSPCKSPVSTVLCVCGSDLLYPSVYTTILWLNPLPRPPTASAGSAAPTQLRPNREGLRRADRLNTTGLPRRDNMVADFRSRRRVIRPPPLRMRTCTVRTSTPKLMELNLNGTPRGTPRATLHSTRGSSRLSHGRPWPRLRLRAPPNPGIRTRCHRITRTSR